MTAAKATTLAGALVAAQAAMPKVEPDATNPHFRSKFVSLDHLIAKTRPVLNEHGLAVRQSPTHIDGQPALETTIHHGPSGESVSSVMPLLVGKSDMQGLGAALTYARRYAWAAALGICADEDDDGNSASAAAETKKTGPPEPTADQLTALYALVEERGGDVSTTMNAAETAGERGKLAGWYGAALAHWSSREVATEFQKKAADAIVAGGAAQDARAAQAQADRGEKAA